MFNIIQKLKKNNFSCILCCKILTISLNENNNINNFACILYYKMLTDPLNGNLLVNNEDENTVINYYENINICLSNVLSS